jgi:hypothetical protein
MRQITSSHSGSSEFTAHSLLHLHNLQFQNYCHRQYHSYFPCFLFLWRMLDCNWLVTPPRWRVLLLCSFRTGNTKTSYVIAFTVAWCRVYRLPSNSRCTGSLVAWFCVYKGIAGQHCVATSSLQHGQTLLSLLLRNLATDRLTRVCLCGNSFHLPLPSNG